MSDYRVSDKPEWQPYRSPTTGRVVMVTPDQCAAIMRALAVWQSVNPPPDGTPDPNAFLLGRLLYQGRAPLRDAPPLVHSAPDYSVEVP